MRLKNFAAAVAASSLMLASTPAFSAASALSLSSIERAAPEEGDSEFGGSGFKGFLMVFGAGMIVGALLYSVIKGEDEPVSP